MSSELIPESDRRFFTRTFVEMTMMNMDEMKSKKRRMGKKNPEDRIQVNTEQEKSQKNASTAYTFIIFTPIEYILHIEEEKCAYCYSISLLTVFVFNNSFLFCIFVSVSVLVPVPFIPYVDDNNKSVCDMSRLLLWCCILCFPSYTILDLA